MKEPLTFEEWIKQEGYKSIEDFKESFYVIGADEDVIDDAIEDLKDQYNDYLEEFEEFVVDET